jgi:hypothetical protein
MEKQSAGKSTKYEDSQNTKDGRQTSTNETILGENMTKYRADTKMAVLRVVDRAKSLGLQDIWKYIMNAVRSYGVSEKDVQGFIAEREDAKADKSRKAAKRAQARDRAKRKDRRLF